MSTKIESDATNNSAAEKKESAEEVNLLPCLNEHDSANNTIFINLAYHGSKEHLQMLKKILSFCKENAVNIQDLQFGKLLLK